MARPGKFLFLTITISGRQSWNVQYNEPSNLESSGRNLSKKSVNKNKQQEMKSIIKIWRDDELFLVYGKHFRKTLTLLNIQKLLGKGNTTASIAQDCRISQENIELCLAYKGSRIFEGAIKFTPDSTGRTDAPCSICDQKRIWVNDDQTSATLRCGCRLE